MAAAADKRADPDLQINLLAEHELTRLVEMVEAVTDHPGIRTAAHRELHEIKKDVAPEAVRSEIEAQQRKT